MKKFFILAMFIIAGLLTKAQSNYIAITFLGFQQNYSVCQGSNLLVLKLKLENVTSDDSTEIQNFYFGTYNSQSTTVDSVIVRDTFGNLVSKSRLINGNCSVPIYKYLKKYIPQYYNVYIRATSTGIGSTSLYLQNVSSTHGYDNPNGQNSSYFYVANCNTPDTINVKIDLYGPMVNRTIRNNDTVGFYPYQVYPGFITNYSNPATYDWYLNDSLVYKFGNTLMVNPPFSIKLPLGKVKFKIVAHGVGIDYGSDSLIFYVVPNKIDCQLITNLSSDTICPIDYFSPWVLASSYNYQLNKIFWYLNDSVIHYWDSSMITLSREPRMVNLSTPGINKFKVIIYGEGPDRGSDSVTMFVKQRPPVKISLSANKICTGSTVTVTLDTSEIKHFIFDNFASNTNHFVLLHGGQYWLHIEWKMGCISDTVIYITEYPSPDIPVVGTSDCKAWVSTNADSIVWFKYQTRILNSNKIQIDVTEPDLYYAEVFNSYGCSKKSSMELVNCGHGQVNCKIIANVNNDTICPMSNFNILVSVPTYTYPIKKSYLTLNGNVIHFWDSSSNWTMNPPPINLTSPGIKKFKLFVFGTNQDVGVDSFTIYVSQLPQIKISLTSDKICTGNVATMVLDTVGVKSFTFGSFSPLVNTFSISHGGQYALHIDWKNGCSSDTTIYITEYSVPNVPVVTTSDCMVWVSNPGNDSIVWYKYNSVIPNSNKTILNISSPDFYSVKLINKSGCSATSQMVLAECGHSAPMVCKIILNSSNLSICPTNNFSATASIVSYPYATKRAYWTMDGVFILNWDTASNWSMNLSNLNLLSPGFHKLKLFVFGIGADKGSDSVILFVKQLPRIKLTLNADKFCTGGSTTATLDTVGIASFTFGNFASNKTQFSIQHEGQYKLHIDWRNGCSSDTSIYVTEYAVPDAPVINSRSCQVWVSSISPGDSIVWYKYHTVVPNSNRDVLDITKADFYYAKVFNKNQCFNESPMIYVECAAKAGIDDYAQSNFKIYPTLVQSVITIASMQNSVVTILDVTGKEVFKSDVKLGDNVFDLSKLTPAMYFLHIGEGVHKIIKL